MLPFLPYSILNSKIQASVLISKDTILIFKDTIPILYKFYNITRGVLNLIISFELFLALSNVLSRGVRVCQPVKIFANENPFAWLIELGSMPLMYFTQTIINPSKPRNQAKNMQNDKHTS